MAELIDKDTIYYHDQLRIFPPPPKSYIDENYNIQVIIRMYY